MSVIRSIHASVLSGLVVAALSSAAFAATDSIKTAAAQPAPAAKPAAVAASSAPAAAPAAAAPAATAAPTVATAKTGSAGRSCDEVKAEIDGKLAAKGVKGYTLSIVAKDEVKDAKVVGSCAGGASKITYKKG